LFRVKSINEQRVQRRLAILRFCCFALHKELLQTWQKPISKAFLWRQEVSLGKKRKEMDKGFFSVDSGDDDSL